MKKLILFLSFFVFFSCHSNCIWSAKCVNDYEEELNLKILYKESSDPIAVFNNQYELNISYEDVDLMARVVYGESCGEPYQGKIAVASVILNRVLSEGFPMTIEEVIKQQGAFSCVIDGEINTIPNRSCYSAVYDALKGYDPTNEALFFYNPKIATCPWMESLQKDNITEIGNHVFFVSAQN